VRKVVIGVGVAAAVVGALVYAKVAGDSDFIDEADRQRFMPDGLTCAPDWKEFDVALQHALNASPVDALASRDKQGVVTLLFDDDSTQCTQSALQTAFDDLHVNRLLQKCRIRRIACGAKTLDITW
jgi:hypothetical protein